MKEIYLDNSATTPICEVAKSQMMGAMECYGNPSSLHNVGLAAEKILTSARRSVAEALELRNFKNQNIIFTSSGTEATNLALMGAAYAKERREKNKIITTDSEHPSVENVLRKLEKDGFSVVRISTRGGVLDMEQVDRELDKNTFMVTMMLVNNETGALYDLRTVFALAKQRSAGVITHCDAVQGFMKVPFAPASIGADMVTLSAHKINGPKGVGALYVNDLIFKERKLAPVTLGGGQESGWRSGTENVIGIAGFGAAAKWSKANFAANATKMAALREYAIEKLSALDVVLNLPKGKAAPHILNITLPRIKSETMLHFLSAKGIYVSSGSACSSHSSHPSSSLIAFGVSAADADCSIRVSLGAFNEREDIDALSAALAEGIEKLVKVRK